MQQSPVEDGLQATLQEQLLEARWRLATYTKLGNKNVPQLRRRCADAERKFRSAQQASSAMHGLPLNLAASPFPELR